MAQEYEKESDYGFIFKVSGPLVVADNMSGKSLLQTGLVVAIRFILYYLLIYLSLYSAGAII